VIEVSSQVFVSHAVSEKLNFGAKTAAWASGAPVLCLSSHEQQRIGAKTANAISLPVISPTRISVTRREDSTSATDGNSDQAG
jgi:hypothetical protein